MFQQLNMVLQFLRPQLYFVSFLGEMPDVFTKAKRSRVMAAIKSKGNKETELHLARMFRTNGITGWRRHQPHLGKPDFTFAKQRVVLFVDGCFWHACPKHGRKPSSNRDYWTAKLARNKLRDRDVSAQLKKAGWNVLRIWEHDLRNTKRVIMRIKGALRTRSV